MSEANEQPVEQQNTEQQPIFSVEKLYVKDLSLEVPQAPGVFLENGEPQIDVRVSTENSKLEDEFYNVTVNVTVTAKLPGNKTMFLTEVAQSGIFRLANLPESDVQLLLAVAAPNILFPYARETVSNTISRAGFPPVLLAPINFEAIYQSQQQAQQGGNA